MYRCIKTYTHERRERTNKTIGHYETIPIIKLQLALVAYEGTRRKTCGSMNLAQTDCKYNYHSRYDYIT